MKTLNVGARSVILCALDDGPKTYEQLMLDLEANDYKRNDKPLRDCINAGAVLPIRCNSRHMYQLNTDDPRV